jgi:hypothetical protein
MPENPPTTQRMSLDPKEDHTVSLETITTSLQMCRTILIETNESVFSKLPFFDGQYHINLIGCNLESFEHVRFDYHSFKPEWLRSLPLNSTHLSISHAALTRHTSSTSLNDFIPAGVTHVSAEKWPAEFMRFLPKRVNQFVVSNTKEKLSVYLYYLPNNITHFTFNDVSVLMNEHDFERPVQSSLSHLRMPKVVLEDHVFSRDCGVRLLEVGCIRLTQWFAAKLYKKANTLSSSDSSVLLNTFYGKFNYQNLPVELIRSIATPHLKTLIVHQIVLTKSFKNYNHDE